MAKQQTGGMPAWLRSLLGNNRFWILAIALTVSVNVAGIIQLQVADTSLQMIRIEQIFGFLSILCLYLALLISPVTKVIPNLPLRGSIIHARRAIGVSAFYFAALHASISFFGQLDGFQGLGYLSPTYIAALILGAITLLMLTIMAATSFDVIVKKMGYKHWKLLHRFIYIASLALIGHVLLIGPHFDNGVTGLGLAVYAAIAVLLVFEIVRIIVVRKGKHA